MKKTRNLVRVQLARPEHPRIEIQVFEHHTLLTRREGRGVTTYPVNPDEIARLFANIPVGSGLLGANTLATGWIGGHQYFVHYYPACPQVDLLVDVGGVRTLRVPTPPLIWYGHGTEYRVFAVRTPREELTAKTELYQAPFPNTYSTGRICWGSSDQRPVASEATMATVLRLFLSGSAFNTHVANGKSKRHAANVTILWNELQAQRANVYPLDDLELVPWKLGTVIDGLRGME